MTSVLITGTSKGIGLESALAFGRAGHRVHATMRKPSQAPLMAETAAREKLPITVSSLDADSDQSVSDGIGRILKDHGPIDVLVNNAGVERVGSVEEVPLADFRSVMETNYFGAIRCIQALVPHMRQRRSGCIINVTSVAGRTAGPPMAPYTASKWALEALSEALAGEMKLFNVRVAILEPGIIDTAMAQRIADRASDSPYPPGAFCRFILVRPEESGSACAGRTEDCGNRGEWDVAAPPPRRTRRCSTTAMAQSNDRRTMGRPPCRRRRNLVPRHGA